MGIINVLDKHTANLIAAGEVVERPASAVKEMLENCADAGASAVTVEIKDGGTSFVRITDNGCGMAREDVPKAILRHATSKIKTGSDLEAIGTLGFRGEALAAIAAVSSVRILTKRPEDEIGTLFVCRFGEVISTEDAGCPDGTTIIVENIFENTPARRKFLKKNTTEGSAVLAVCEKFALSRPNISVRFLSDGNPKLQTPGDGKMQSAVYAALEEGFRGFCPIGKFPACVLFVELDLRFVDVNIHPAKLEIKFSDERKVFDTLYFAVKNALSRGISGVFAAENDAETISVPQMPQTTSDSQSPAPMPQSAARAETVPLHSQTAPPAARPVSSLITDLPENRASLLHSEPPHTPPVPEVPPTPSVPEAPPTPSVPDAPPVPETPPENLSPFDAPEAPAVTATDGLADGLVYTEVKPLFTEPVRTIPEKQPVFAQSTLVQKHELAEAVYVGEVFDTYLLAEYAGSLYIIDKHAAHERIIYERIKHTADTGDAQFLLEPLSVTLTPKEYDAVQNSRSYFAAIGFDFEEFGADTVLVRSAPTSIAIGDCRDVFTFLAGKLAEGNTKSAGEIFDRALYTAACKAAIKAGNKFTDIDNRRIVQEIFANDAVLYCPHGRPVLVSYTKERLEKMFGRT